METIVLVMVVPILAPIMMGIAPCRVMTPPATKPTVIDVVVEELWMMLVVNIPMSSPTIGWDVVSIKVSANPFPMSLKEVHISWMERMKR